MSVNFNDTLHKDGLSALETVDLNKMFDNKDDQKTSRKESFDANKIAANLADKTKDENLDLEKRLDRIDHKDGQKSSSKKLVDANDIATKLLSQKSNGGQLQQTNKKDGVLDVKSHDDTVNQTSDASKLEKMSLFASAFDLVTDFFGSKNRGQELEKLKLKHQAIKTNVEDLNSSIKILASDQKVTDNNEQLSSKQSELNAMLKQDETKNIPTRKTDSKQEAVQMKSASAENEMIDQRATLIANQQTIEENISKLKLKGE